MSDSDEGKAPAVQVPLDREAYDILAFIVDECRKAADEYQLRWGICWADIQRWQADTTGDVKRRRIYACLLHLVKEGYLREGVPTHQPPIPGLSSDRYWPTEKAFGKVDWDRRAWWQKLLIESWQRQAVLAALLSIIVSAIVGAIVAVLFKLFG